MFKRVVFVVLLLVALFTLPGLALDFTDWRTDGIRIRGTSVYQQASNQAFNIYDNLFDASSATLAVYWKGEKPENGVSAANLPFFADQTPPSDPETPQTPIRDNREQDPDVDWTTWPVVTGKAVPPSRPIFTPVIPQAWNPIVVDMADATAPTNPVDDPNALPIRQIGVPDHLLVDVSFEPVQDISVPPDQNLREQVLNAYYPQTASGLPGNGSSLPGPDQFTTRPLWIRNNNTSRPGLRIRDLGPLLTPPVNMDDAGNNATGVVTHPPIFARVPARWSQGGTRQSNVRPVVYLVVGTGETFGAQPDYAYVVCLDLTQLLPNPNNPTLPHPQINLGALTAFNPADGTGHVLWSYRVKSRINLDSMGNPVDLPTPVAGISFANIGDSSNSEPLLFVTTGDGQVICLNARAADDQDTSGASGDGDPRAGQERWKYLTPSVTPAMGVPFNPGFYYGMSPAVTRVPLAGALPSSPDTAQTLTRARQNHNVTEWLVFVADTFGTFRALEAHGKPQMTNGQITGWDPGADLDVTGDQQLVRWEDLPAGNDYRKDRLGNNERFIFPPVVYQGNTPLRTVTGGIISGTTDSGFDDEVLFLSEKGQIYALDCVGRFTVDNANAADDGRPLKRSDTRWIWPTGTAGTDGPALVGDPGHSLTGPAPGGAGAERAVWPAALADPNAAFTHTTPTMADRGNPARIFNEVNPDYDNFLVRSPLAVALGPNTNPNNSTPNLDIGDDVIFSPYLHVQGTESRSPLSGGAAQTYTQLYEYVGSLKPYGFIQVSRPIERLVSATVDIPGVGNVNIPLEYMRVGTVKTNGEPSNFIPDIYPVSAAGTSVAPTGPNPNYNPSGPVAEDTVYFVSPTWWDTATDQYVTLRFSYRVNLTYETQTSASDTTIVQNTETLDYPSCYRRVIDDPTLPNPTPRYERSLASLAVHHNRLEFRRIRRGEIPMVRDEEPALVLQSLFDPQPAGPGLPKPEGWRQPAMYAAGSANAAGSLFAPSFFRGRIVAFDHRLRPQVSLTGYTHPFLIQPNGVPSAVAPNPPYGYNTGDPGDFTPATPGGTDFYITDIEQATDVGGSVTLIDGWLYVTYRNGHIRAYANEGGGAAGTVGYPGQPTPNPPLARVPPSNSAIGNVVKAPVSILVMADPNGRDFSRGFLGDNPAELDSSVLLEYGQILHIAVDFGDSGMLRPPQSVNPNDPGDDIDGQVLQTELQGLIKGGGAIPPLPGNVRGVRPQLVDHDNNAGTPDHVVAIVPIFVGTPSGSNPLTPGTPLLWERQPRDSANPNNANQRNNFTNELVYEIAITQTGLQWRWPDSVTAGMGGPTRTFSGNPNPAKQHFWESERPNQQSPTGTPNPPPPGARYWTTGGTTSNTPGGTPRWSWIDPTTGALNEWAPLVSYNNPIILHYDPNVADNNINGIVGPGGTPVPAIPVDSSGAIIDRFTTANARLDSRRKNGDWYVGYGNTNDSLAVDGSRSGAGQPVVATVGVAVVGNSRRQALFGEHGKTTPAQNTIPIFPDAGRIRVGDRSLMASVNRNLPLRIQRAPLTKMGMGWMLGAQAGGDTTLAPLGAFPAGSFDQNRLFWDDGPSGLYSSIPESRLLVTKSGTNIDLASTPIQVAGRWRDTTDNSWKVPSIVDVPANQNDTSLDILDVQVDIPQYTGDDLYATRWRSAGQTGMDPRPVGAGTGSRFDPFQRPYRDRAEKYNRPPGFPQGAMTDVAPFLGLGANNQSEDPGDTNADPNTRMDDRLRRVVIFNDANGNGLLDLSFNFREAYRTFAVQVMVKPDMKIEAQEGLVDFGNLWHGKKQPGTGPGVQDIREWQKMNAPANATEASVANFYRQYWRPFTLKNTGNVNLTTVKPEVFSQTGSTVRFMAVPSEANDPWRALTFISLVNPASLTDPQQILLRTSFDDQLLPDTSARYAHQERGIWLQKAQPGAGLPGTVLYADPLPGALALRRDPSSNGVPRPSWITMNIPTGTAMGEYAGVLRFFNDRSVTLVETPNSGVGFAYVRPAAVAGVQNDIYNGLLDRDPRPGVTNNLPLEPVTDPPLQIKARVIENMIHGRFLQAGGVQDSPDRRAMPAVTAFADPATGTVNQLLMAYISNLPNNAAPGSPITQPLVQDLFGSELNFNAQTGQFPYDELPLVRGPWLAWQSFSTGDPFYSRLSANSGNTAATGQALRPSLVQDPTTGVAVIAWTERASISAGSSQFQDDFRIKYQVVKPTPSAVFTMLPGGLALDTRVSRQGVKMVPARTGGGTNWLAFYAAGLGSRRSLAYSATAQPDVPASWSAEQTLATSRALATVADPTVVVTDALTRATSPAGGTAMPLPPRPNQPGFILQDNARIPQMAWIGYSGTSQRMGRQDVYLSRFRMDSLLTPGQRGGSQPSAQGRARDFGLVGFPTVEREPLHANPARTVYTSGGLDWLIQPYNQVQVYLGRAEVPAGTTGSMTNPVPLLNVGQVGTLNANGEVVFQLSTQLRSIPGLTQARLIVDPAAGIVRFTLDARTLARLAVPNPPMTAASPDPVLFADYTPTALRITHGDAAAGHPVVVPVLSTPGGSAVYDASWYRQQIDGTKFLQGQPVAGIADRMWVFWRKASGAVSGGPTVFYKVLRPGVRVRSGAIFGILPAELQVNGGSIRPEEVNPQTGQIYFPFSMEGQRVQVTYRLPTGGNVTEELVVTWQDESGERPVPMDTAINEGGLDAVATYEGAVMTQFGSSTGSALRHMERIWLFWSSSRSTGGDLFYAAIAPRIGPEPNVGGTVTVASDIGLRGLSPSQVQARIAAANRAQARNPITLPPLARRGPFLPMGRSR